MSSEPQTSQKSSVPSVDCACGAARRGLLLLLSAPSGAGKTTLARALLDRGGASGGQLERSVSVTTRAPRPGEAEGKDYHFVSEGQFADLLSRGEFLENAEVYGHRYGTPRLFVEEHIGRGVDLLLVLDARGREQVATSHGGDLVSIFLLPPSRDELERRLRGRGQEDETTITRRLAAAHAEIFHCHEYDYVLINRDFDVTLESLDTILRAERLRRERPALPYDELLD